MGRAWSAGSSSPRPRPSFPSRRSGYPTRPTCCRRRWPGCCCRAHAPRSCPPCHPAGWRGLTRPANALSAYDLPGSLAGLSTRGGEDPGAVGVYGRGPTTLLVLPLRGQVAGPLRSRLRDSGGAEETTVGILAPVGPVGLLLTPRTDRQGALLLTGTVTGDTLRRAAAAPLGGAGATR